MVVVLHSVLTFTNIPYQLLNRLFNANFPSSVYRCCNHICEMWSQIIIFMFTSVALFHFCPPSPHPGALSHLFLGAHDILRLSLTAPNSYFISELLSLHLLTYKIPLAPKLPFLSVVMNSSPLFFLFLQLAKLGKNNMIKLILKKVSLTNEAPSLIPLRKFPF